MIRLAGLLSCLLGCTHSSSLGGPSAKVVPHSLAAEAKMVVIAAGTYVKGSNAQERERAYDAYLQSYGKDGARKNQWFQYEESRGLAQLPAYQIDLHPVTQQAYAEFIASTSVSPPFISEQAWRAQRFSQDYQREVQRYNWDRARRQPPRAKGLHPVVLVTWKDADAYCRWRGKLVGETRRLPTAAEFEKAAGGPAGAAYPWGDAYDASKLNSADEGPRDTTAVIEIAASVSARGVMGMAGNVFQWTRTPWPRGAGRMTVKGSAWDDHGGLGRAASGHGRRRGIRHAIVGFRCAGESR